MVPKQTLTTKQAMRYNRQILLPGFDLDKQELLLNARVLQIGVGGLGCAAAQYLVAAGVGEITLVDDDEVDLSNLQRQVLHSEAKVGINKCLSAKQSLAGLNSETLINIIDKRLDIDACSDAITKHNIVLDCSDNLATRNQLNQLCYQTKTALVSGAAIRMEGQLLTVLPKQQSACYACVSSLFGEQQLSCVESGVMSPVVGVIGAMQALEAIKVLCDFGDASANKLLMFDALSMEWQKYHLPKNPTCAVCSSS